MSLAAPCIAILGGSFDPVHRGHVALAQIGLDLLKPSQLRIIPTGWSPQKKAYRVSAAHRLAMLRLALQDLVGLTQLVIDEQEIIRAAQGIPSYSVETLRNLRQQVGPAASLVLMMGADQLAQLQHWKDWQQLFELAHLLVVTRPGFVLNQLDMAVAAEFSQRAASVQALNSSPLGLTFLYADLHLDISSTQIRQGNKLSDIPSGVLDYIQQHHLY